MYLHLSVHLLRAYQDEPSKTTEEETKPSIPTQPSDTPCAQPKTIETKDISGEVQPEEKDAKPNSQ